MRGMRLFMQQDVLPVVCQAEAEEESLIRLMVDQLWRSFCVIRKHAPHLVGPLCLTTLQVTACR